MPAANLAPGAAQAQAQPEESSPPVEARGPAMDAPAAAVPDLVPDAIAADAGEQIIDREVLDELRSVLGGEVDRLIAVFLDDTPQLIIKLEAAAFGPDFSALREAAHSLKSSSANLGAMALSGAAKRVELGARMGTLDRPAVAVAMIAREYERVREALLAGADQAETEARA